MQHVSYSRQSSIAIRMKLQGLPAIRPTFSERANLKGNSSCKLHNSLAASPEVQNYDLSFFRPNDSLFAFSDSRASGTLAMKRTN